MGWFKKKIDWSKFTKQEETKTEPVDTKSYPYEEVTTRESGKLTNKNFGIRRTVYKDHGETPYEAMQVALLMDIRDRLDALVEGINKNIEE